MTLLDFFSNGRMAANNQQNARRALEIGDVAYLLVGGKNAFEGTARELLEHKELGRLYLGVQAS